MDGPRRGRPRAGPVPLEDPVARRPGRCGPDPPRLAAQDGVPARVLLPSGPRLKNKGITRSEFDKMLNAHKKESKNGINETQEYINNLSFAERRKYNTALGNILETQQSESLRLIKIKIYNYIAEHEDSLDDIESYLKEISKLFDDDFDVKFTDDMKSVQYINDLLYVCFRRNFIMNVIFDKIYIFDVVKKEAYSTEFKKGVNIITSSDIDGTDRGKSVLLRNLYHTLGADSHFDSK